MQQLELFPEDIRIERVDPKANMHRFYRLRLMPDLFGGVSLLREWGRIGAQGRLRVELFADAGQAADAMVTVYRAKQKRGYRPTVPGTLS
ncbi:MAG: WGR domain-containing protein [Cyanobacteria bacterium J06638_22]